VEEVQASRAQSGKLGHYPNLNRIQAKIDPGAWAGLIKDDLKRKHFL
jgi:hypothetical protein